MKWSSKCSDEHGPHLGFVVKWRFLKTMKPFPLVQAEIRKNQLPDRYWRRRELLQNFQNPRRSGDPPSASLKPAARMHRFFAPHRNRFPPLLHRFRCDSDPARYDS